MKKAIYIGLLILGFTSSAQQVPHYTQYMYNMNILNPAYVGARADLSLGLLHRSQWVGIEGAPKTTSFSVNGRIYDGLALGFSAVQDKLGLFSETAVNVDISYTLVVSQYDRLALGLKGGLSNYSNNLASGVTPDNESYLNIDGKAPNLGLGMFYYNNKFYAGFSIPSLLKNAKYGTRNINGISKNLNYFATAGMVFNLTEKLRFKPSTLIKYVKTLPLSFDLNSNFLYDDKFEIGVSYRYDDSVSGLFALIINKSFRIGYTYDHTLSNLGKYNNGSHEIMLLFDIDFQKRGRWLKNSSCFF